MAVDNKEVSLQEIKRIGKLTNDGVFIYHLADKRFTFINQPFVKIVEINKKLLAEEPDLILHSLTDIEQEYLRLRLMEILEKGFAEDIEIRLAINKNTKILSCNAYLTSDNSNIIGMVKNVSKAREHEEYLINFGARKDTLLDMVSQNLSTPLNLSKFTVDLIEKAVQEKKYHKLDAHVRLIREVTSECIRIIDKFLQEEHLESPRINAKANRFDVVSKIMIVLDKLKEMNPEKQFRMTSPVKHLFINADSTKFFQIVHNLLSNAIKFTKPKGTIEVQVKDLRDHITVTVKDDGIGIPGSDQPFVFEKKSRAARPGLNGEISNGIGLYVVRQLTAQLNGKISFESKVNKGTMFTLELPKE